MRAVAVAARARLSDANRKAAGSAISEHGAAAWSDMSTVAAYLAVGTEPPTQPLIERLVAAGVTVLLPVIDGDRLDWTAYTGADDLAAGPLGIVEPTGARLGESGLATAEVIVVPALAVDRRGNRLGRGRGYYDRALADVTVPVVAVTYDDELLDDVPVEPHDRAVDAVLQPRGISHLR
jgi:5-formyltetrahydrofolate cyclo-ligase